MLMNTHALLACARTEPASTAEDRSGSITSEKSSVMASRAISQGQSGVTLADNCIRVRHLTSAKGGLNVLVSKQSTSSIRLKQL